MRLGNNVSQLMRLLRRKKSLRFELFCEVFVVEEYPGIVVSSVEPIFHRLYARDDVVDFAIPGEHDKSSIRSTNCGRDAHPRGRTRSGDSGHGRFSIRKGLSQVIVEPVLRVVR